MSLSFSTSGRLQCPVNLLLIFSLLSFFVSPAGADTPLRVVSVGGALTEIVYQLGAENHLVGVDTTSLHPKAATELPQVGYQRALSAEGVLSLSPDIVLTTDQAGPPAVLQQIKLAGIKVITIPTEYSAGGVANKIISVSEALGMEAQGQKMSLTFMDKMTKANSTPNTESNKPKVMFLLNVGQGSPMAAGTDTAANAMIELANATNAMTTYKSYKPISTEALVAANPDVLLLPQRTLDALGGLEAVLLIPGVSATNAGKHKRVVAMAGLYMLGFTPRLPDAVQELSQLLHSPKSLNKPLLADE